MVKVSAHLYVSQGGRVRLTKNRGEVAPDEIVLRLDLDIPAGLFQRPYPVVTVVLEERDPTPIEAVVDVTSETVARALKVNVADVRDGLEEALRRQEEREA